MPRWFDGLKENAKAELLAWLHTREDAQGDVADVVRDIIYKVRKEGDAALLAYTQTFDKHPATDVRALKVTAEQMAQAKKDCAPDVVAALELAATRIKAYHEKQKPEKLKYEDESGTLLGWQWRALSSVGLYVPGGRAAYPSSVLMNALPAKVAGVKRLVMVVPAPEGVLNPAVLVAAQLAGVDEIYTVGGAQAVAALAYGTDMIAPVDKIVGPGNAYVAEAKRQVFGRVGMDTIAGPSEILIVADSANRARWIAADLLSQAEHDPQAQSILLTDTKEFADKVVAEIEAILPTLSTEKTARAAWETWGAIIVLPSLSTAAEWVDLIAPEHLELAIETPDVLVFQVQHAGAIFIGRMTPEAIGDYLAGPSHVLPTSRAARFGQGLSVLDFMKRTSLIGCSPSAYKQLVDAAATLADAEGLPAHALSLRVRQEV